MYQIDKDIPIPVENVPVSAYPFSGMEVGDSFLIPCKKNRRMFVDAHLVGEAIRFRQQINHSSYFKSHYVDNGVRVWRII